MLKITTFEITVLQFQEHNSKLQKQRTKPMLATRILATVVFFTCIMF